MKITIENSKLGTGEVVLFVPDNAYGAVQILVERYRVITEKGRTVEQDAAQYEFGELLHAAASHQFRTPEQVGEDDVPFIWPFSDDSWRGGTDPLADLVRAGQFIAAEIDRLSYLADVAKNPGKPLMTPDDGGEAIPGQSWPPIHRLGEVERRPSVATDPEAFDEDARLHRPIEPGTGSDPATWFDGALLADRETAPPDKSDN